MTERVRCFQDMDQERLKNRKKQKTKTGVTKNEKSDKKKLHTHAIEVKIFYRLLFSQV